MISNTIDDVTWNRLETEHIQVCVRCGIQDNVCACRNGGHVGILEVLVVVEERSILEVEGEDDICVCLDYHSTQGGCADHGPEPAVTPAAMKEVNGDENDGHQRHLLGAIG